MSALRRTLLARAGAAAGAVALALVGVLLALLPSRSETRALSSLSFEPEGLRALFLTAEALGYPVEAWSDAPGRLAGPGTVLVLASPPREPPKIGGQDDEAGSAHRQARDRENYRRFVETGGTLLALGMDGSGLAFLRDELGLPGLEELGFRDDPPGSAIVLATGEELRFQEEASGGFAAASATVLGRAEDGRAVALVAPSGAGRVALLAVPAERFDNRSLRSEPDHALLFVRLLEALGPSERVLFDEYALGTWRPDSVLTLAFGPRLACLSLHALLLLLVLGWRSAWSGPFPRDPEPVLAASPLARARGFGQLLARAGRFDLLARFLRGAALERWQARAGGGRMGARMPEEAPALAERLRELAHGDEALSARLRTLFSHVPKNAAELAALEARLAALETELLADRSRSAGERRRETSHANAHP